MIAREGAFRCISNITNRQVMSEDLFKSPEKFDVVGQRLLTSHHLGPNTGTTSEGGVLEPPEVAVVDFAISSHLGQLPKPPQALRPTLFAPEAGLVRKQVIGTVLVHIGGTKVGHGGPQSLEPAHLKAPRAGLNVYSCSVSTTARTCKHRGQARAQDGRTERAAIVSTGQSRVIKMRTVRQCCARAALWAGVSPKVSRWFKWTPTRCMKSIDSRHPATTAATIRVRHSRERQGRHPSYLQFRRARGVTWPTDRIGPLRELVWRRFSRGRRGPRRCEGALDTDREPRGGLPGSSGEDYRVK